MPIRKRNKLWQIDVITSDGRRLRRSFVTKGEAAKYAAEHQKPLLKKARRKGPSPQPSRPTQKATTQAATVSPASSSNSRVRSGRISLQPRKSPISAPVGPFSRPERASAIRLACVTGCNTSMPLPKPTKVSHTLRHRIKPAG